MKKILIETIIIFLLILLLAGVAVVIREVPQIELTDFKEAAMVASIASGSFFLIKILIQDL